MYEQIELTPPLQTGNQTHVGVSIAPFEQLAIQFIVDVAGAGPTVTWKIQGSVDDPQLVTDANARWYDLAYVPDSSDTVAVAARTATAVGGQIEFASNTVARKYRRFRLVTTANTNVTYHATAFRTV